MKKKLLASLFTFAIFVMVYHTNVYTNRTNPPNGRTGGPGEASCAASGCHGDGNAANPGTGVVALKAGLLSPTTDINDNFAYIPDTTYQVSVVVDPLAVAGTRFGFQLIVLDQNDLVAGTFVVQGANQDRTGLENSNGRVYVEHRDADGGVSWVFEWTTPAASVGPVTFYVAVNAANANGTASGDVIYELSQTINPTTPTGLSEPGQSNINNLSVFPNPIDGSNFNTSFEILNSNQVEMSLFSMDGKMVELFMNESLFPGMHERSYSLNQDLSAGVYFLALREGNRTSLKKVLVR